MLEFQMLVVRVVHFSNMPSLDHTAYQDKGMVLAFCSLGQLLQQPKK